MNQLGGVNRIATISLICGLIIGLCSSQFFLWWTLIRPEGDSNRGEQQQPKFVQEETMKNKTVAEKLYDEVRVLCWIMTNPNNHQSKAIHIKRTWGKRCNKLLIMSTQVDDELGSIALPVEEGRDFLWGKTKEAFKYIYKNHFDDADWFMKADDDTYAVVENLRFMLYPYSPETPIYFGCKFAKYHEQGYMSGGPGYVLSKEALRRFIEEALPNSTICRPQDNGVEDAEMGICLGNVNVMAGDSRDSLARGRFFPGKPEQHLLGTFFDNEWYSEYQYYKTDEGLDCCSNSCVSFHYITPAEMYLYDYMIYQLQPYGVRKEEEPLPERLHVGATQPSPTTEATTKSEKTTTTTSDVTTTTTSEIITNANTELDN